MKRDYRDENFEEFIKRSADNLRMKAPERVWEKLSGELNKSRRNAGTRLSAFFLVVSVLGYLTISTTNKQLRYNETASAQQTTNTSTAKSATQLSEKSTAYFATGSASKKDNRKQAQASGNIELNSFDAGPNAQTTVEPPVQDLQADFTPSVVDSHPEFSNEVSAAKKDEREMPLFSSRSTLPWSIESTTNFYLEKKKRSRFQTQFYFTPTISYRKLSENKSYLRNSQAFASANYAALYGNVNSMVTHKPDIGFELGVTEKYSVSKKVRVRAGLQFNVNRYDIKAFQAPYALASIALNNRRTARVDSLWTLSNYSNVDVNSNKGSWLQNFSFQVSAPVGVELALKGNDKMQFGIATSIQPTYILGDRSYMITSDYKSYTQVPWLLRRWNVNTAFETFVAYQSGKTRWQFGPQVRYQLLSSFISNYPVKENLFDFGLKIGVSMIK